MKTVFTFLTVIFLGYATPVFAQSVSALNQLYPDLASTIYVDGSGSSFAAEFYLSWNDGNTATVDNAWAYSTTDCTGDVSATVQLFPIGDFPGSSGETLFAVYSDIETSVSSINVQFDDSINGVTQVCTEVNPLSWQDLPEGGGGGSPVVLTGSVGDIIGFVTDGATTTVIRSGNVVESFTLWNYLCLWLFAIFWIVVSTYVTYRFL